MSDRRSLNRISINLDSLQSRVAKLESSLDHKLEAGLAEATSKLTLAASSTDHGYNFSQADLVLNTEQRRQKIEEIAYLRAEERGFTGGDPAQDWLDAEKEVDQQLMISIFPAKKVSTPASIHSEQAPEERTSNSLIIRPSSSDNRR